MKEFLKSRPWYPVILIAAAGILLRLLFLLPGLIDGNHEKYLRPDSDFYMYAANALADDSGRIVLLITSVERGNNSAEIFAPDLPAGLVSTTGNTVETEPGIYKFSGTDADYDILVMP